MVIPKPADIPADRKFVSLVHLVFPVKELIDFDPINGKTIGRKKISRKPIKKIISRSKNFYVLDETFNLFSLSI